MKRILPLSIILISALAVGGEPVKPQEYPPPSEAGMTYLREAWEAEKEQLRSEIAFIEKSMAKEQKQHAKKKNVMALRGRRKRLDDVRKRLSQISDPRKAYIPDRKIAGDLKDRLGQPIPMGAVGELDYKSFSLAEDATGHRIKAKWTLLRAAEIPHYEPLPPVEKEWIVLLDGLPVRGKAGKEFSPKGAFEVVGLEGGVLVLRRVTVPPFEPPTDKSSGASP